jgi:hypothetical protein
MARWARKVKAEMRSNALKRTWSFTVQQHMCKCGDRWDWVMAGWRVSRLVCGGSWRMMLLLLLPMHQLGWTETGTLPTPRMLVW